MYLVNACFRSASSCRFSSASIFLKHILKGVIHRSIQLINNFFKPIEAKKLFAQDWTDGLHLKDMPEYKQELTETETVNIEEHLDLTEREHEIFTMLLKGVSPKDIGYIIQLRGKQKIAFCY